MNTQNSLTVTPRNQRPSFTAVIGILFFLIVLMPGCKDSSESGSLSSVRVQSPIAEKLSSYGADIRQILPQMEMKRHVIDLNPNEVMDGFFWSVQKLFSDSGESSLFARIALLDQYIDTVNRLSHQWGNDGTFDSDDPSAIFKSATINNTVKELLVPFYGGLISVDRLITFVDAKGTSRCQIGFSKDALYEEERALIYYETDIGSETGLFYTWRDLVAGTISIWHASTLSSGVNFKWYGIPSQGWFSFSYTGSVSGISYGILAGRNRSMGDAIALSFRSMNSDASKNAYYLTLSPKDILNDLIGEEAIFNTGTKPLDGKGLQKYISPENPDCLGWIPEKDTPRESTAIAWEP